MLPSIITSPNQFHLLRESELAIFETCAMFYPCPLRSPVESAPYVSKHGKENLKGSKLFLKYTQYLLGI